MDSVILLAFLLASGMWIGLIVSLKRLESHLELPLEERLTGTYARWLMLVFLAAFPLVWAALRHLLNVTATRDLWFLAAFILPLPIIARRVYFLKRGSKYQGKPQAPRN